MTIHVTSLVPTLVLIILLSRATTHYQGDMQYYDMDREDLGDDDEDILDVSHPDNYDTEDDYYYYQDVSHHSFMWSFYDI